MCGIAGAIFTRDHNSSSASLEMQVMEGLTLMKKRGPDHSSTKNLGPCVLGHARLRIIDLSSQADQPMSDGSGRYWLVFNGEIFNYRQLRKDLEKDGVSFNTASDTEVLLQLLIHKKEKALDELNGFFAFAFFDTEKNELLLARDRYGEKPLWYHHDGNMLCFASELKGLKPFALPREIDIVSLSMFLQFSYIPAPHSIFRNIFKLDPGSYLHVSRAGIKTVTWYHRDQQCSLEKNSDNVIHSFRNLLEDAVKLRINSDVPLGCFLSGGMDSSVIALLASKHVNHLQTFSVAMEDQPFLDETRYAVEVAKHIGSNHQVIPIHSSNLLAEVDRVWAHMDEPFADSSSIAVALLSERVREKVTVALSGDGADELLGGYNKHSAIWKSMQKNFLNKLLPFLRPVIDVLPESRNNKIGNKFRQVKKYAQGLEVSLKDRYVLWASWADEELCELLVTQEISVRKGARINAFVQDIVQDDFNTLLMADQKLVLSNDMLVKIDSMSMMHALEVRAPFLDYRVVEYVNSLPVNFKVDGDSRKILLAQAYKTELPASVFQREKKGFEVPMENWLRNEMKPRVMDLLGSGGLASSDFIKTKIVQNILNEFYKKGNNQYTSLIYSLMVFEHWYRSQ